MEKSKVVVICLAVAVTAALVTGLLVYFTLNAEQRGNEIRIEQGGNYDTLAKYLKMGDLENLIEQYYYKDVDEDALIEGSLRGLVESLGDPFSAYYSEEEFASYQAELEGTNVGIGASFAPVSRDMGILQVTNVYGGGPAQLAGITTEDIIIGVNGRGLQDLDYDGAVALIDGASGSSVTLTVQRNGEARNVELTRANVDAPEVSYTMLDDRVGLIVINSFSGNCVAEFQTALSRLEKEEGARGIIIDVRSNMAGTVTNAVEILDLILPSGSAGYSVDRNGTRTEWTVDTDYDAIPIAVLADGTTANAAEVFTAAVKERGRGMVIGQKTYGKGVEQLLQEMPYGSGGGVKITTAEYFSPDGNSINSGVDPSQVVAMPEAGIAVTVTTDPQIQTARETILGVIGGS